MKKLITLSLAMLSFVAVHAQYGGDVRLKITYKGKPLVGYTITGSINKIDIGGKGVTDSQGNVTLRTQPLPVPQIDVQGKKTCGGANYEWEVSGYVYLDNNYFHLKLEQPINSIAEMSGMDVGLIIGSYGFNCEGSLGSDDAAGGSVSSDQTSGQGESVAKNETPATPGKTEEELKAEKKARDDAEYEQRKAEQKEKHEEHQEYVASGQMRADGLANQESALTNSIDRINRNISVKQNKLTNATDPHEKEILQVEIEELTLERKIKEIKLEKTRREMEVDYLTKVERQDFRDRINAAETEHDACKEKLKKVRKGSGTVESDKEVETESDDEDDSSVYSIITEAEIPEASTVSLKTRRTKLQTRKGKIKANLKMKSGIMKQSKIEQMESEIELIETLVDLIDAELEKRKEDKTDD